MVRPSFEVLRRLHMSASEYLCSVYSLTRAYSAQSLPTTPPSKLRRKKSAPIQEVSSDLGGSQSPLELASKKKCGIVKWMGPGTRCKNQKEAMQANAVLAFPLNRFYFFASLSRRSLARRAGISQNGDIGSGPSQSIIWQAYSGESWWPCGGIRSRRLLLLSDSGTGNA
jgi:hypothetical protein